VSSANAEKRTDKPTNDETAGARRVLSFGKYRLFARLGTGGMADVYLSVAQGAMNVNRLVVIKRLRDEQASDPSAREMFLNEARLAARLNHPNVIQTFEAGNEGGSYFLAMEYVDGQPMSRVLTKLKKEGKTLEPRIAARIVSDALNGLHYAHELCDFDGTHLQIVHRDVSPQNVMLTYEGVVKLVDFGIAKAVGTAQTAHGVFKGKVAFMAPEQVLGDQVDRRADVFAAGIVLWESVVGKPLMAEDTPAKTLYNLMNKAIPRASELNPSVPEGLSDVIAKSLERDVTKRYQTAKEMRDALEAFITSAGGVTHEEVGDLTKKLFADTREKVTAQIKVQLATLSLRNSEPGLSDSSPDFSLTQIRPTVPMLIDLGENGVETTSLSNAGLFRVVTSGGSVQTSSTPAPAPASTTKRVAMVAWVGITLLALGASGLALFRSQKAPPAPAATTAIQAAAPAQPAAAQPATATATATAENQAAATTTTTAADAKAPTTATATAAAAQPRQNTSYVAPSRPVAAATPAAPHTAAAQSEPKTAEPKAAAPSAAKTQDPPQGRTFRRDL